MDSMLAIFQKLSLFRDCTPSHVREMMQICSSRAFKPGEELCKANAESDGIFILLTGTVEIQTTDGLTLLEDQAITTIGESGLLTDEPRSATVVAKSKVTTLWMHRRRLNQLLHNDQQLSILLYRNVMSMMRKKLVSSNERIAELLEAVLNPSYCS